MVDRRLEDGQGKARNMVEEKNRVGQIIGWYEIKRSCGQTVYKVAGMGEVNRGKVEQKVDILFVERRNTVLTSNN